MTSNFFVSISFKKAADPHPDPKITIFSLFKRVLLSVDSILFFVIGSYSLSTLDWKEFTNCSTTIETFSARKSGYARSRVITVTIYCKKDTGESGNIVEIKKKKKNCKKGKRRRKKRR